MRGDSGGGVVAGDNDVLSAHLLGIRVLLVGVGDDGDLGAESSSELDSDVSQSTESDDTDLLGLGSSTVGLERVPDGGTCTQQGSGSGEVEAFRDGNDKGVGASPVVGVTTLRVLTSRGASLEFASVGSGTLGAEVVLA